MRQLGALPILLGGSQEQKRRYLPPLASGEWLVTYGVTEAGPAPNRRSRDADRRGPFACVPGRDAA